MVRARSSGAAARVSLDDADPVLAAFLNAPVDTRPETEEERAAVEAAKASRHMVPQSDVMAALDRRRRAGE